MKINANEFVKIATIFIYTKNYTHIRRHNKKETFVFFIQ